MKLKPYQLNLYKNQLKLLYIVLLILISFFTTACTNNIKHTSQASLQTDYINVFHREKNAHNLFQKHQYYDSLIQWEILSTIEPENTTFKNRTRVLKALIKSRTRVHMKTGRTYYKNKKYIRAKNQFLIVLSLNPFHKSAQSLVQKIEISRIEKIQNRKTRKLVEKQKGKYNKKTTITTSNKKSSNNQNSQEIYYLEMGINLYNEKDWRGSIREIKKYYSSHPGNKKAADYLHRAHILLADKYEKRGHLAPAIQHIEDAIQLSLTMNPELKTRLHRLNKKIAINYYIDGVKIYRDDIDQAIIYWKRSLEYDINNKKSKQHLDRATKFKLKLNNINPR